MLESKENAIEFLYGDKEATCTFCSPRFVNKARKLAEKFPDECQIVAENPDGSVVIHCPVKYIKLSRNAGREMTEEEKAANSERFKKMWEERKQGIVNS